MIRALPRLATLLLLAAAVAACGTKGPLKLPDAPPAKPASP
jgi:predicted small lipoprotein YifL